VNAKIVFSVFFRFFFTFMYSFSIRQFFCECYFFLSVLFFSVFFPLCIRFQLGNSFVNTKIERTFHFMYSFSIRQFICEY
jgi:hypothetical protein